MEEESGTLDIRGFINDLTRTLTASLAHLDDLLITLDNDSDEMGSAQLLNDQLSRALEYFLEMRSGYLIYESCINKGYSVDNTKRDQFINDDKLSHSLNDIITNIIMNYDLIRNEIKSELSDKIIDIAINALLNYDKNIQLYRSTMHSIKEDNIISVMQKTHFKERISRKTSLLLIEDQLELREIMSIALSKKGYVVFQAKNGKEALNIFVKKYRNLDKCLIDIELPDANGIELGNQFLANKKELKVVYTSGYDYDRLKRQFGVPYEFYYIRKPFRLNTILDQLANI